MIRVCEKQRRERFPEQVARDPQRFRLRDDPHASAGVRGHARCVGPIDRAPRTHGIN